ncbi:DUF6436 domain-containing protein [Colwellia sp. MB02u-9]|uniref:DUF6436 domain-containing protein n=1 Tax=Colwellia sp. MB02u-9 TaxID=2759823 RepID=UPI0015F5E526|nr:DUF6436 domain-containing protein [Colwellia sp. MB02u-9]MBA6295037.1 hypothetical protein [Colwellia sp. MB02u-9]
MKVLNKQANYFHYILFAVWIIGTIIAAIYFISARLVMFDPDGKLKGMDGNDIMTALVNSAVLKDKTLSNTIIHFSDSNCRCAANSEEHKLLISTQAEQDGFNVLNLSISNSISHIIPSTPSALIIDAKGKLIYFGPYSEGLDCSSSNSLIKIVLDNYKKGYNAKLILAQTKGCYCNV